MFKKISILSVIILSGCASYTATEKSWSAVGGSRADGVIKLAYPISLFDNSSPSENEGTRLASQRCKVWGYRNAVAFGGTTTQCEQRNGFGHCLQGIVIKEYQCTN